MSDQDQIRHPERECGDDVAAYALGALDHSEVGRFRAHLETCSVCRDELASFQQVADALPLSAPAHRARSRLRRRVLREVRSNPRGERATGSRAGWPGGGGWPWPALAAAAVIAVIVFAGLRLAGGSGPPNRVLSAQVTGRGSAQLRLHGDHGELVLRGFSPPPRGKIYELWIKRPHQAPRPAGALFSVTPDGSGDVAVPAALHPASLVMVTPEPSGGSRAPTHPPVLSVSVT